MMPNPNQQDAGGAGESRSVKIIEAIKPSFSLSFDNSPTELSAWLTQFKSFYDASKLHRLPLEQQQLFLSQGLAPDIWTVTNKESTLKPESSTALFIQKKNPVKLSSRKHFR